MASLNDSTHSIEEEPSIPRRHAPAATATAVPPATAAAQPSKAGVIGGIAAALRGIVFTAAPATAGPATPIPTHARPRMHARMHDAPGGAREGDGTQASTATAHAAAGRGLAALPLTPAGTTSVGPHTPMNGTHTPQTQLHALPVWMATYRLSPGVLMMYEKMPPVERTPTPLDLEHWYISLAGLQNEKLATEHETASGATALQLVKQMAENNELAKKRVRAERSMISGLIQALLTAQDTGEGPGAKRSKDHEPIASSIAKVLLAPILPAPAPESDVVSSVADTSFVTAAKKIALERPHDLHRVVARYIFHTCRLLPHQPWRPSPPATGGLAPMSPESVFGTPADTASIAGSSSSRRDFASPLSTLATRVGTSATSTIPPHPDADMPVLDRVRKIALVAGNHTTGAKASVLREVFRGLHRTRRTRGSLETAAASDAATENEAVDAGSEAASDGARPPPAASNAHHAGHESHHQHYNVVGPRMAVVDRRARAEGALGAVAARAAQPVRSQFSVRGLPSQVMPIPKEVLAGGSSTRGVVSASNTGGAYRGRAYLTSGSGPGMHARAVHKAHAASTAAATMNDASVAAITASVVALADEQPVGSAVTADLTSRRSSISSSVLGQRAADARPRIDTDNSAPVLDSLSDLGSNMTSLPHSWKTGPVDVGEHSALAVSSPSGNQSRASPVDRRVLRASISSLPSDGTLDHDVEPASEHASVTSGGHLPTVALHSGASDGGSARVGALPRTGSTASLTSAASMSTAGMPWNRHAIPGPRALAAMKHLSSSASVMSGGSLGLVSVGGSRISTMASRPLPTKPAATVKPACRIHLEAALADFKTFTVLFARGLLAKYPALNGLPTLRTSQHVPMSPGLLQEENAGTGSSPPRTCVRPVSSDIIVISSKGPAAGDAPVTDTLDCARLVLRSFQEAFHILVYDALMPLFQQCCQTQDEEWMLTLDTLRELPPCVFGLGHVFCVPGSPCTSLGRQTHAESSATAESVRRALSVYGDAVMAMRMIPLQTTPMAKVSAVRTALRCVAIAALVEQDLASHESSKPASRGHAPNSPVSSPTGSDSLPPSPFAQPRALNVTSAASATPSAVGADDLLPRLIFVVLHSGVPRLFSELTYMEECLPQEKSAGEEGYAITSLRGALMHLLEMHRERQAAVATILETESRIFDDDEDDGTDSIEAPEESAISAEPHE